MKKDEWILTKELGRLRKLGFYLQAERIKKNERYNIVFEKSRKILEPNCSIEEIIGIINSLETCINLIYKYMGEINGKNKKKISSSYSNINNITNDMDSSDNIINSDNNNNVY